MVNKMIVVGEKVKEHGYESGCLKLELGSSDCREFCPICELEGKLSDCWKLFTDGNNGPGK